MDDAFRKQMDSKEANHREEIEQIMQQKQEEIDVAYQKVPKWMCQIVLKSV